jgi:putative tryptophan/tyrosine transport system substrate-binding protein
MLRKALLALCLVASICTSASLFGAEAQSAAKVYRIGWLTPQAYVPDQPGDGNRGAFIRAMNDLGYVEGRNLVIDFRYADGKNDLLPSLAAELVALKPDVIVAVTTPATKVVRQATTTIPIVIVQVSDPVGSGFVTSLARPGGNITGITDLGIDLTAKYVELAHAIVPEATRIGVLMADNSIHPAQLKLTQDAAASIGLTVLPTMDRSDVELEQGFAALTKEKADALIVLGGSPMGPQAERIAQLAEQAKLPTLYPDRYYVTRGGLLSYGPSYRDMYIVAAAIVNKILNGAKPADLPIEQPTRFELVINLKKAEALHLLIPRLVRLRADELIQ